MTYLEFSRILTFAGSMLITVGLYEQAWKIWRTRSAKDFTLSLIASLLLTEFVWLNYGVVIHEWPIYAVSIVNIPAALLATWGYVRFRKGVSRVEG